MERLGRRGPAWHDKVGTGEARQDRHRGESLGQERPGPARQVRRGTRSKARQGEAWQGRLGGAARGQDGPGEATQPARRSGWKLLGAL